MYATYKKIETWEHVPPAGPIGATTRETLQVDFKATASPQAGGENAKDMALFANGFGGVILVGSKSENGVLEHPGIPRAHADRLAEHYNQTAKDRCSPCPVVNAILIEVPASATVLVAVNVDPAVDGPVGASVGGERDGWVFPIREGNHTKYLKPTELPMHMNPKLRRVLLLLGQIPDHKNAKVILFHEPPAQQSLTNFSGARPLELLETTKKTVHLARNTVEFSILGQSMVSVPLAEVEDAWVDSQGEWNVRVAGRVERGNQQTPTRYFPVSRSAG